MVPREAPNGWISVGQGRITASRMADVVNYLAKGGEGAKRKDYRLDLVARRLTAGCAKLHSSAQTWLMEHRRQTVCPATGTRLRTM